MYYSAQLLLLRNIIQSTVMIAKQQSIKPPTQYSKPLLKQLPPSFRLLWHQISRLSQAECPIREQSCDWGREDTGWWEAHSHAHALWTVLGSWHHACQRGKISLASISCYRSWAVTESLLKLDYHLYLLFQTVVYHSCFLFSWWLGLFVVLSSFCITISSNRKWPKKVNHIKCLLRVFMAKLHSCYFVQCDKHLWKNKHLLIIFRSNLTARKNDQTGQTASTLTYPRMTREFHPMKFSHSNVQVCFRSLFSIVRRNHICIPSNWMFHWRAST